MKKKFTLLIYFFVFQFVNGYSQPGVVPFKSENSVSFGQDIVINDHSDQNQRHVVICSAFNGWLYGVYSYFDAIAHQDAIAIVQSKNNGVNWSVLLEGPWGLNHVAISKLDILACGTDTNNLKLFVGYCIYDTVSTYQVLSVVRHNRNGISEEIILQENSGLVRDFALASDNLFPANNSTPFSLAVVYSKGTFNKDSIVVWTSSNGGISLNKHYNIASSSKYFHRVALTYGHCASYSTGRYFAAWEEQENANSATGHIYTAHSEPNFNSSFTVPFKLDSLEVTSLNNGRYPSISCQNNNADNDSSNLTEIVLFDKYIIPEHRYETAGYYNMKATNSNHFKQFILNSSTDNKQQPSINFNSFDSKFLITYYDSTSQKLPFLLNNFNMTTPDNWQVVSAGYNESNALTSPFPKIAVNMDLHQAVMVWSKDGPGSKGVALFDAPYNNWAGLPENDKTDNKLISVFPNPSSFSATLNFELKKSESVNISLFNIDGRYIRTIANQQFETGTHQIKFDVSGLPPDTYFYSFKSNYISTCGKIVVIR